MGHGEKAFAIACWIGVSIVSLLALTGYCNGVEALHTQKTNNNKRQQQQLLLPPVKATAEAQIEVKAAVPPTKDEAFRVSMGFIDVETSPEAIQEDEDLIEAVETFVGSTAHTVYKDIMNDIDALLARAHGAITTTFPFLVRWREDSAYFWNDMEKFSIFLALFLIAFFVLAPWGRRRRKKTGSWHSSEFEALIGEAGVYAQDKKYGKGSKRHSIFHRRHSTSSPAMATLMSQRFGSKATQSSSESKPETPEEKFAQRWPSLSKSKYRRLVLPPECKRVAKPRHGKKDEKKRRRSSAKSGKGEEELDEDHPIHRLRGYYTQCKHLVISFLKFDYIGFFFTLTHMLQACLKPRRSPNPEEEIDDDDESDAGSIKRSSVTSQSSTAMSSSGSVRGSLRSVTGSKRNIMAGKDHDNDTDSIASGSSTNSTSNMSRRSTTSQHPESIIATSISTPRPTTEGSSRISFANTVELDDRTPPIPLADAPKVKDALQNYRTGSSRIVTPPPMSLKDTQELLEGVIETVDHSKMDYNTRHSIANPEFFDSAESQEHLENMPIEAPMPDDNGYILGDELLPENNFTPLLVFVNSRSGQRQGELIVTQLRNLLNPIQVWDLADGGPEEVLKSFLVFTKVRVLVCGGDGTVSWIVGAIEKLNLKKWPPMAILPLGTGNDLARVHGWGGGFNNESLTEILQEVTESYVSWLDRWEIIEENKKGKVKSVKEFLNYLGVGADAQAALQVHMLRESRPQLFFSRVVNKIWYALFGAEDIIKPSSVNLPHEITLIADGVEVPLPSDSQGIILLNIDSYAGGVPIWSTAVKDENYPDSVGKTSWKSTGDLRRKLCRSKSLDEIRGTNRPRSNSMDRIDSAEDIASMALTDEEKFKRVTASDKPSSCQDGLLDIVSIRGLFHLGQIQVGLSNAQKLCQCRSAEIIIRRKVPVQLDGEPWRQNVSVLKVKRKKDAAIMLHRTSDDSNGVESEMTKLLDWAEDEHLIAADVHAAMMKEFSRRIERKTRQKRGKPKENLMFALKRAMASSSDTDDQDNGGGPNMF